VSAMSIGPWLTWMTDRSLPSSEHHDDGTNLRLGRDSPRRADMAADRDEIVRLIEGVRAARWFGTSVPVRRRLTGSKAIQEAIRSSIWLIADEVPSTTPMSNTC
jgi:hypothetical protein